MPSRLRSSGMRSSVSSGCISKRGGVDEEARSDEFFEFAMVAQHVADVLAQETLDALAEFLHAIDVLLLHAPGAVGGVGLARLELADLLLDFEIPGDVGHQIANSGKALHRLDGSRACVEIERVEPRHAHQLGHAVDLGGAGAALAGFAVPAHGQVGCAWSAWI
jgi:hypothetical protein